MTETKDPGAPRTDELARNVALHALADAIGAAGYAAYEMGADADPERVANDILGTHTVTWERDINSAGVPVRRYVMRGEWTVDPEPPAYQPQVGDIVLWEDDEDEWEVRGIPYSASLNGYMLVLIARPDWARGQFMSTTASRLKIVRRPS
jgi:hypothetical protein